MPWVVFISSILHAFFYFTQAGWLVIVRHISPVSYLYTNNRSYKREESVTVLSSTTGLPPLQIYRLIFVATPPQLSSFFFFVFLFFFLSLSWNVHGTLIQIINEKGETLIVTWVKQMEEQSSCWSLLIFAFHLSQLTCYFPFGFRY